MCSANSLEGKQFSGKAGQCLYELHLPLSHNRKDNQQLASVQPCRVFTFLCGRKFGLCQGQASFRCRSCFIMVIGPHIIKTCSLLSTTKS